MLMKKALLTALALGLICVWAAPAIAIDWSAMGGFTVKNAYYKNIDYRMPYYLGGIPGTGRVIGTNVNYPGTLNSSANYADPAWNADSWWLQMRGDIFIYARASEDLYGVFGIEVNSTRFGDPDPKYIGFTGVTGGMNTAYAGRWNADAAAIQVKTMLIDFKVPEIPVWFTVGIQPYMIRPATFLYVDAAGVTARTRFSIGDATVQARAFWAVIAHGTQSAQTLPSQITSSSFTDYTTADDGNFFGVDINAAIGTVTPGVFFAMQRQPQVYGNWYLSPPGVTVAAAGNENLFWIGPYVDAKFGPVSLTGDFIYNGGYDQWDSGTMALSSPASATPTVTLGYSRKHEAYLFRGVASYTLNKFKFGVGGLYGSGDNFSTTNKMEGFQLPKNSEACKFNDDFLVLTGDFGLRQPYGTNNIGGLYKAWSNLGQGVWYVRGFADYAVTDWLKLKANFGYIGDTAHGQYYSTSTFTYTGGDEFGTDNNNDDSIGWEIDGAIQINIYKNLYLDTAFGYLIGGKALLSEAGGYRAQDPWAWMTVLTYQF
jgi:hypothetical protein